MRKGKKLLSGLLALVVVVQSMGVLFTMETKASESEIVFHDFENTLNSNASGSLTTEEKYSGEQGLMYSKVGDYAGWNVEIDSMDGAVDVTDMSYIKFWIKDSSSNDLAVKLIDENGRDTEVWTEMKSVAGEWTLMSVPLSSYDFDTVDATAIAKVAFYEWNDGIYYIDDIIFTNELPGEEVTPTVYDGEAVWFQTFDNETEDLYEVSETGATATVDVAGCEVDGEITRGLVYEKTESASPEIEDGSVLIKANTPVDVSGLRYLVFYIKDTNGSNTLKVSLIDAEGKETDFGASGWSELKTEKDNWKQYYVPIRERAGTIDLTQVTGVRIGQWNQGTYYIDNVYFDNYLYAGKPISKEELPSIPEGGVVATVEPGKYTETQQVELIAEQGAVIYYTLENNSISNEEKSEPTTESEYYKGAFNINTTTTIKAISVKKDDAGDKEYKIYEFAYEIVPYPVEATSEPGEYVDQAVVELRTKNSSDLIYYTMDGSVPDRTNAETTKKYVEPMLITESVVLNTVAYDVNSGSASEVSALKYVITDSGAISVPVFSKPEGTYGDEVEIEIKSDSEVHYTTDGSVPTIDSDIYKAPITVDKDMTIRAIAIEDGVTSEVATAEYILDSVDTPFLKTDGEVLKDNYGTGDTITLRGTNAGGWLVTENWQCPITAPDQLTALNVLTDRFGAETAQNLIDCYQDNWWTEEDFDLVKEEGMNVLRLPITYFEMLNEDGSLKATAFNRLEWFVQNCEKRGLYVLIDMHGAVGSQNGKDHSGDVTIPDVGNFYGNEENIDKTIELWKAIAERYKDNPWVCGYDLLNEPSAVGTQQFEVYDRIYDAIRTIDKNHVIYIQAIWDANHLPDPSFYGWENVVYQYHIYGWHVEKDAEGQKEFIRSKVNMVEETDHGVPVLVGEFSFFSNEESWKAIDIFEENGWSYTSWTFKVTDGGEGSSWGMYTSGLQKVDVDNDSLDDIKDKWAADKLNTSAFTRNATYADVLKGYFTKNTENKPRTEAATGIEAKTTLALKLNETKSLEAKNVPENTAYKALSYESSNTAIAEVDAQGVVTAKAEGTAVITVTNLYGMTKECTVTVTETGTHTHTWSEEYTTIKEATTTETGLKGQKCTGCDEYNPATQVVIPKKGTQPDGNKDQGGSNDQGGNNNQGGTTGGGSADQGTKQEHTHTWSEEYTTMKDATAKETGMKGQKCTGCDEYNPDTQKVIPKYTVKLNAKSAPLQVKKSTTAIKATVMEGDKVAKWTTSDKKIATVTKKGKIKAGKKTGKAKITVMTVKGAKATITIKVQKEKVKTTSISVTNVKKKKLTLKKGEKIILMTKLNPITSPEKIKFKSSDKKIVTVNNKGKLTAKKKGKVKMTVSSGKEKLVLTVEVK